MGATSRAWLTLLGVGIMCAVAEAVRQHRARQTRNRFLWMGARRVSKGAIQRFCAALPKVELHAHLHGCARLDTIRELAPPGVDKAELRNTSEVGKNDRSLDACFAIFGAIHKTVTTLAAVRRITREVLSDFAADGVKYLELRTTPRALADADVEGYVRALLAEVASFEAEQVAQGINWSMTVRLLLSVDRSGDTTKAMVTVQLAARLRAELGCIVGVDFSGNPTRSSFEHFREAFEAARLANLRVAVHVGEVNAPEDTAAVIDFRPERLGHALLLSTHDLKRLREHPIPIELCPTSNLKTLQLNELESHPTLTTWLAEGYPVSISTDDSTVFDTTSSRELALAAMACHLSVEEIAQLACAPLAHAFDPDMAAMDRLRRRFEDACAAALARFHAGGFDE